MIKFKIIITRLNTSNYNLDKYLFKNNGIIPPPSGGLVSSLADTPFHTKGRETKTIILEYNSQIKNIKNFLK